MQRGTNNKENAGPQPEAIWVGCRGFLHVFVLFCFVVLFCDAGDGTQDLAHARQEVYHQAASPFFPFFETKSHYPAQSDLELAILLPPFHVCWDYRCEPPHLDIHICMLYKFISIFKIYVSQNQSCVYHTGLTTYSLHVTAAV
jgi:hypothetical protein